MVHYSCDRCGVPLSSPVEVATNPMLTMKEAKQGVILPLPMKSAVPSYAFVLAHLCESCLSELAIWKDLRKVDQSQVYDH